MASKPFYEALKELGSAADLAEREFDAPTPIRAGIPHAGPDAGLHVVMVPFPLQGHINPMLHFARTLIAKHGVSVTIINNQHIHDRIQGTLATASMHHANMPDELPAQFTHTHGLSSKLQLLWLDNGLPSDFKYTDLPLDSLKDVHAATTSMKDQFKELLLRLNQKCPHVSCVLFDSFCQWAHSVAVELSIPSVFFWSESTSVFSIYYHSPLLAANGFFPYDKKSLPAGGVNEGDSEAHKASVVSYIPGVLPLPPSSFPTVLHIDDLLDRSFKTFRDQFGILGECKGVIINSFEELEKEASQAIRAELRCPVYLVGPLTASAFLDGSDENDRSFSVSLLQEKNECIIWLDSQRKHSVLYISFGSICSPSSEDLEAIASGVKSSKQPFLWVIRSRSSLRHVHDILPKDFIEDTKEYGCIIPWAPQTQVLSHPSVGAFLTHCGWNSTLESLSMGVPMIPFPVFSDQTTNCAYVCDVWKAGIALKRDSDGTVKSEGVERAVRAVLNEEEGKEMRERAGRLKEAARQAVLCQGSSSDDIENFIKSMKKHI